MTIKSGDIVKFEGEVVSVGYGKDGVPETATVVTHDGKGGSVIPVEYLEVIPNVVATPWTPAPEDATINVDTDDWKSFVHELQNKGLQKTYDDDEGNGTISIEVNGEKLAADEDALGELMTQLFEQVFGTKTLNKTNKEPKQQAPRWYVQSPIDGSYIKIPKLQDKTSNNYTKDPKEWKDNPDYQWSAEELEYDNIPEDYLQKV